MQLYFFRSNSRILCYYIIIQYATRERGVFLMWKDFILFTLLLSRENVWCKSLSLSLSLSLSREMKRYSTYKHYKLYCIYGVLYCVTAPHSHMALGSFPFFFSYTKGCSTCTYHKDCKIFLCNFLQIYHVF